MSKKQVENSFWQYDTFQFPRLICELKAAGALKPKVVESVCESMDILPEELDTLIARASEKRYENTQRINGGATSRAANNIPVTTSSDSDDAADAEIQFIETLEALGGKSGNIALRKKLKLSEGAYELLKNKLLSQMKIKSGLGRGGSVILN